MTIPRIHTHASWRTMPGRIIAAVALAVALSGAAGIPASAQAQTPSGAGTSPGFTQTGAPPLPPGVSHTTLRVKLRDGTPISASGPKLPSGIAAKVSKARAQFSVGKAKLDGLRATAQQHTGRDLPDLSLWYTLTLTPGADAATILQALQALPEVEVAHAAALPAPPPATPDYSGDQVYLGSLGATDAWAYDAAGAGEHVTIYDVEYSWNTAHEDLSKAAAFPLLIDPGDTAIALYDYDHGTAVLGELVADDNGFGVTGIAHNASVKLAPTYTANRFYDPANAIILAALDASPGDVILLEQQASVCGTDNYGPTEYYSDVWQAIRTATDYGIIVVEAAGNGSQNLDASECQGVFKPSHDSGAIIVGAGESDLSYQPRAREWFSTYGKRVNVQAWGDSVMTTGYGYAYNNGVDANSDYTAHFSGTSSASPMVAGVVANMQSLAIELRGEPLSPEAIRSVLVRTGSPQTGNRKENIGPQVRAGEAIAAIALARPSGRAAAAGFVTTGSATLKWKALKDFKDQYRVRVDDDSNFGSPEVNTLTGSSSLKVSGLPFGDYFWQVAALDVDGGSFQVTALKSPKDGGSALTGSPAFKWGKIPGATEYTIEIDTDPEFVSPGLITGTPTRTSFTPPAPLDMGVYYWHIKASAGAMTDFTPAWTLYRTLISAPKDGAATPATTPKLAWKAWPGASEYEVRIDDNPALSSPDVFPTAATKLSPPLDYGRWFWDVRASAGATTPETPVFSFEVTALTSPKDGSVTLDTTPIFRWRKVADAGSYRLIVGTAWDDAADQVLSPVLDVAGLVKTSYTPLAPLAARTTYYWQIITANGKTMPVWSFTEP